MVSGIILKPDHKPEPPAASHEPLPSRRLAVAWLIALGACLVASVVVARWHPLPHGFQLRSPLSSDAVIVTPEIDLEPLARLPPPFTAHWRGTWKVRRAGQHVLHVKARGQVRVAIDGREVVVRTGPARNLTEREAVFLERGVHALEVEYTSPAEEPFLRVLWSPSEGGPRGFAAEEVTPQPAPEATWRLQRLRQALRGLLLGATAALVLLLLAWRARHAGIVRGLARLGALEHAARARRLARAVAWALPIAVVAYGAALRIEALEGRLWGSAAPGWVQRVAQTAEALRFDGLKWHPAERRYDGDPKQYLEYARESRSFYEAHRREPLFVYTTRLGLWLAGGDDIGISVASLLASALAVGAAYLVGAQAFSPAVGLLAAFLLAVERQMVALSIEGWRDDTFLLFVLLSTWALLRLDERPSVARGALLGVFGALACLTRITALSFLIPALALMGLRSRRPWTDRARLRGVAAACLVLAALLGPFLWSCWRTYGDPFYAINVHTHFYRREANLPQRGGMGWTEYLRESLRPFQLLDLGLVGLTSYPFMNKWDYFGYWAPWLPRVMMALALIGLVAFLGSRAGRLLLGVLVTSTLPYAFTWEVPGGAEWRFTAHTYPFYFLAIAFVLDRASRLLDPAQARAFAHDAWAQCRRAAFVTGALASAAVLAIGLVPALHFLRLREATAAGAPGRVDLGTRGAFVFADGWSGPDADGQRTLTGDTASLRLPLRRGHAYDAELCLKAEAGPRLPGATLNAVPITVREVSRGEQGAVLRIVLDGTAVRDGINRLALRRDQDGLERLSCLALWPR